MVYLASQDDSTREQLFWHGQSDGAARNGNHPSLRALGRWVRIVVRTGLGLRRHTKPPWRKRFRRSLSTSKPALCTNGLYERIHSSTSRKRYLTSDAQHASPSSPLVSSQPASQIWALSLQVFARALQIWSAWAWQASAQPQLGCTRKGANMPRSSSREGRTRVPNFLSVIYFSRGTLPQ